MDNILEFKQKIGSELKDKEVEELIRALSKKGILSWTKHAKERMLQRNISTLQIINCLSRGILVEGPIYLHDHGGGYQAIFFKICSGENIKVVVTLKLSKKVLVITAFKT